MKHPHKNKKAVTQETASSQETPLSPSGLPKWVFWVWGLFTCVSFIFLVIAFLPHKPAPLPHISTTQPVAEIEEILPQGVIWTEDFEETFLDGWVGDWMGIYQDRVSRSKGLFAGKDLKPTEGFEFTPTTEEPRMYYATKTSLSFNYKKPYVLSFDFSGSGPIDLVNLGHIRLRLTDQIPNLSYDPRGDGKYRSFNLPPWPDEKLNRPKHHFDIAVTPDDETIMLCIDKSTIGHIEYSRNMRIYPGFNMGGLPDPNGKVKSGFVFYDNIKLEGTPLHKPQAAPQEKIGFVASTTPAPVPTPSFSANPEYKNRMKNAWKIYNSGDFDKAILEFKVIVKEYPQSPEAYNGMGLCYRASGDTTAAWKAWIQSLTIDSTYVPARQNLGMQ